MHTDDRNLQPKADIIQEYKSFDFYSRKLISPQKRYMVIEK